MWKERLRDELVFVIHEFLSPEECAEFIRIGEDQGFTEAPITTSRGFEMHKDIRNNTRAILDNFELAAQLWERTAPFITPFRERPAIGLNERFRFYKYEPGQRFAPHYDGRFERENGERSEYSFLIYLNDSFEGGHTVFHSPHLDVNPEAGSVLVFYHPQLHEGAVLEQGVKYVLRSDVMFAATPGT